LRTPCTASLALLAALTPSPPAWAEGDAGRGARVFQRCYSCHSVDPGEKPLQGPNLAGVIGRRAGTLPRFEYSEAMTAAGRGGLVWTEEKLDLYVTDPEAVVPGTAMGPVRLGSPADRADLIAYLKSVSR
jgi:cytochrome c